MAATPRRLPIGVGRFTYWDHTGIRPEESESLLPAELDNDARHALVKSTALRRIARAGDSREEILKELVWWKSNDPLFSSDQDAARRLMELTPHERIMFARRTRAPRFSVHGRQDLAAFVRVIARDQVIYETSLRVPGRERLEQLTGMFGADDARSIAEILRHYRKQERRLQGDPLRNANDVAFLRTQGFQLADDHRVRQLCTSHDEVFHWLAHALRNLLRRRDGHPPLPWDPSCRTKCLQLRDEHAGIKAIRQRAALTRGTGLRRGSG